MTDFDWSVYDLETSWLPEQTIYVTRHGSQAYGTSRPDSDLDLRGIAVSPMRYYLGVGEGFEQEVIREPDDLTVYDIRKFLTLAKVANPNVLELLYTEPEDHLVVHPVMRSLFDIRDTFLTQKVKHTFSGYSRAQMKRIRTHRRWLMDPPTTPPTRAEYDLPERTVIPADQLAAAQAAVQKQIDQWSWHEMENLEPALRRSLQDEFTRRLLEITQWSWEEIDDKVWFAASRAVGLDTNFIELLDRERRYTGAQREWANYQRWKKERNPARAALEAKHGYDTKHAMHLVRLARMCREILTEGIVRVRRPDAEDLLTIRDGAWTYDQLVEFSDKQDAELDALLKTCSLPWGVDERQISKTCMEIILHFQGA